MRALFYVNFARDCQQINSNNFRYMYCIQFQFFIGVLFKPLYLFVQLDIFTDAYIIPGTYYYYY